MRKLLILLVVALGAVMGLAVLAYKLFGGWGLLGAFVIVVVGLFLLVKLAGWVIRQAFLGPFKMKSAVLRDAIATVHSVTVAAPPEGDVANNAGDATDADLADDEGGFDDEDPDDADESDDDPPLALDWYLIDVTIQPGAPTGKFTHWEPGELNIVPEDVELIAPDDDMPVSIGDVGRIEVWQDDRWVEDEGFKYIGTQRLRLHTGIQQGVRRAQFHYYFEVFGDLQLPVVKGA